MKRKFNNFFEFKNAGNFGDNSQERPGCCAFCEHVENDWTGKDNVVCNYNVTKYPMPIDNCEVRVCDFYKRFERKDDSNLCHSVGNVAVVEK